jgi:hypothetical protein
MRILLFAFLLLTLPLRGWAGDVMAIRMATHQGMTTQQATLAVAASPAPSANGAAEHADCMGHVPVSEAGDDVADAAPGAGHCNTCSFCQLCFSVAVLLPDLGRFVLQLPQQPARFQSPAFISADTARGLKPPIS